MARRGGNILPHQLLKAIYASLLDREKQRTQNSVLELITAKLTRGTGSSPFGLLKVSFLSALPGQCCLLYSSTTSPKENHVYSGDVSIRELCPRSRQTLNAK